MTNKVLVLRKLALLRDHLAKARLRRPPSAEALASDSLLCDALALSVLVAVQEAIDVAFHVATDEGWGVPASYSESFELLARHGLLDAELSRSMTAAAGLRNRIAHSYASLDADRFWRELPAGLDALEAFVEHVAGWLGPKGDSPGAP